MSKTAAKKPVARRPEPPARSAAWRAEDVVVGRVAIAARLAGALAVLAAIVLAVRPFLPLATAKGHSAGVRAGALGFLGWLPAVVVIGAAGVFVLLGRLPRPYLGVIGAAGALSIGPLLHTIWLINGQSPLDLPVGGQALRVASYRVGSGLIFELIGFALLVAALLLVLAGWTATVTDDDGGFDRRRPAFGVIGLFVGALAAGSVSMAPSSSPIAISPPAVTAQVGLERVGGLVLAVIVVCCCVVAASLRPWLAAAGAWLAVAVMLLGQAVENALVVGRSADLRFDVGTVALLVMPVVVLGLAAAAALVRRRPV
jgi:hypothetical protein